MRFDILTIFPDILDSYLSESILGRAQQNGLVDIRTHDIRKHASDKHHTTDDKPYGGGPGMVMKAGPIYRAVLDASKYKIKTTKSGINHAKSQRIILLSAKGEQFTQKKARELSKHKQLILIAGRYEGVDERVAEYIADEELSIGPYVLSGGELPAMVVTEAVSRLVPGVLGSEESLEEESYIEMSNTKGQMSNVFREYPQYTRPEDFSPKRGVHWNVPEVLLSGDHKKIREWRKKHSK